MRVGLALLAALLTTSITGLGFIYADDEHFINDSLSWDIYAAEHTTYVLLGAGEAAGEESCVARHIGPCADAAELTTLAETLAASGARWRIDISIWHPSLTAGDVTIDDARPSITAVNRAKAYLGDAESLRPAFGRSPRNATEIAINASYASQLGVTIGDTVTLRDEDANTGVFRPLDFTVVGILAPAEHYRPYASGPVEDWTSQPAMVISSEALPELIAGSSFIGSANIAWDGDPQLVTNVFPDVRVEPGFPSPPSNWHHEAEWLAAAAALLVAASAWLAIVTTRRGVRRRVPPLRWLFLPTLIGAALAIGAAVAHAEWVHRVAPHTLVRPPWPPLTWTTTALAVGLTVAIVSETVKQLRLKHHEVVDVDELASETIA